jgi:tripartite-type tricarboxylate transporter receptor subunit TctC
MVKQLRYGLLTIAIGLASTAPIPAQEPFYKGKTMRIIVGASAGGAFDTYSRAIARHMGKHIPGNPSTIVVENMPGAGHLIAANYVYKVAKPDGLTIGHFNGGLVISQILGRPGIEFDALKFEYIGAPLKPSTLCTLTKASGITSMEKWMVSKTPVKLGSTGPGSNTDDYPRILKAVLGVPIHLVTGFKGVADIRLAAEAGEVAGGCWGWETIKLMWLKAIESGDVVIVLQLLPKPHPDLPQVPLAIDFAKTDEARKIIQAGIYDAETYSRPFTLPPGTPKERVETLRNAFVATMKDPEFLAEASKSKLDIEPVSGEELHKTIGRLFKLEPALVGNLKEILK